MQTESTSSHFWAVCLIQSMRGWLCISVRVPWPPGTSSICGCGQSVSRCCGLTLRPPLASTGPGFSATVKTLKAGGVDEAVGDRKDLEWAGEVEDFDVLEKQDGELAGGGHGLTH